MRVRRLSDLLLVLLVGPTVEATLVAPLTLGERVSRVAAAGGEWSLDRIMAHEVGHAMGLDHADEGGQIVNAAMSADPASTSAMLTRDDLAGEYLRYRVNGCPHADATTRVIMQIQGLGIQPVCASFTGTTVDFPPRQEPFQFRLQLESTYRDLLRRTRFQPCARTTRACWAGDSISWQAWSLASLAEQRAGGREPDVASVLQVSGDWTESASLRHLRHGVALKPLERRELPSAPR
ncbi:MAG: matrixin family metalloprotease [Acidobacteriota bacterium]